MCQLRSYEQCLNDPQIQSLSRQVSPRLEFFFRQFKSIFLTHIALNRIDPNYSTAINSQLAKLSYPKIEQQGPYCSKKITQFYRCFTCQGHMGPQVTSCICKICFEMGSHQGHNFRLCQSLLAICDCGDAKHLDKRFFCSRHRGESSLLYDKKSEEAFVKEMQFLLYLFFSLRAITAGYLDENKKKQIYGSLILDRISKFCQNSYPNQNILASLLRSHYQFDYPYVPETQKGKSMLNIMFRCSNSRTFLQNLSQQILLPHYCVKSIRQIVLLEFFAYCSSQQTYLTMESPIRSMTFQFLGASEQIKSLTQSNQLSPLVLNYNFTNFTDKSNAFVAIFFSYRSILRLSKSNTDETTYGLLSKININKLCYFCAPKEEKLNRCQVLILEVQYFKLLSQLIKTVINSRHKDELLKKLIKQTYACIKSKKQSLSFSVERTFSFAVFAYLKYELQNLYDWQQQLLLELFEQEYHQQFIENIKILIKKSLHLIKVDNFNEYKKMIINDMQLVGYSKIMPSIDHIYSQILLMLVIKFQKPCYSQHFSPIQQFIVTRQKAIASLYQLFEEDQMSKAEETMNIMFYEIFLMISNFLFLSQSSISEIIASQYLGFPCEKQAFDIYRLLVYINPENNAKQFKKLAQKYLNNQQSIEKFIKTEFAAYRQQIQGNYKPQNMFNLSYNSFYITPATFKQYNSLYFLKLNRHRKTELSSLLFNKQTISTLVKLTAWLFDIYNKSFKQNEVVSTKNVVTVAVETLMVLYLETRSAEIKDLLDKVIKTKIFNDMKNEYLKQIVEMYLSNESKIKDEIEKECMKVDEQGNKRKEDLKLEKKKLLKQKQSEVLRNVSGSSQLFRESVPEKEQDKKSCIICKLEENHSSTLCYLAYIRYSNLMSKNLSEQNFPIMLITTCGHLIHQQCFHRVHQRHSPLVTINCSVCKAETNILVPELLNPNPVQAKRYFHQFQTYLNAYQQQIQQVSKLQRTFIQLNKFRLQFIASMVYQIFGYSLYYTKYFAKKIMPILKMNIINMQKLRLLPQEVSLLKDHFQKSQPQNRQTFQLILSVLISITNSENVYQQLYSKDMVMKLRMMEANQANMIVREKHIHLIKMYFDDLMGKNFYFAQYVRNLKDRKSNQEHKKIYKLPLDLQQLNREAGFCPKCRKHTSKIMICFLCSKKFCEGCREEFLNHPQEHLGTTAYIRVERGDCIYFYNRHKIANDFLYLDYIGDEIKNQHTFPKEGQFLLNSQRTNALIQDILNDCIPMKIIDSLNRRTGCEIQ